MLGGWKIYLAAILLGALSAQGCSGSPELVSETSVETKISRVRLGHSDRIEVESIFGTERGNDRNRWSYHFADQEFQISDRRSGRAVGALPITAGTVSTNTRVVVTITFSEAGIVKALEVARFFEEPFINEYWFLVRESAQDPLQSIAAIGESNGFKVTGLDKHAGTLSLEDAAGKARVSVAIQAGSLKITSRNPYPRLASEYRLYTKRESAFASGIIASNFVQ